MFENIAYSPAVLSTNSITGDIELIAFRPEWIGDNWYPNQFERLTGTEWVAIADFNISWSSIITPLDSSIVLKDYLKFYGSKCQIQRFVQLNDVMTNLEASFATIEYSINFEIKIIDQKADLKGSSLITYQKANQIG